MASGSRTSSMRRKGVFMKGQVKLDAYMNYGLLTVHVVQGRQLSSTWKSRPDTFVMLSLIPEDNTTTPSRCRTTIVRDNNKPVYNEKFSFEVSEEDGHKRLLVSVWHRDSHSGLHESLGCTSFGLRHLRSGERTIKGWYYLLNDDVGRKKHLRVATRERTPRPTSNPVYRVPSVNSSVNGMDKVNITIRRSPYGGFGFTLVDSCPVKVGRVDSSSHAEAAGLQKDDVVVRVNYQNVSRSTSVSVAKCIKQSGSMVSLEIHRQKQPVPMETNITIPQAHASDESENNSYQEFTICDEKTALINSALSVDTRRQASLHRLLCLEENFVDTMNSGIHLYSRPLRHCILTANQHAALFQNIEKIVCISQYQVKQIVNNLPSHTLSDDDTDTSFIADSDLTSVIGMIYRTKMAVLCQAYEIYADGLPHASRVLAHLELNEQFRHFMLKAADKNNLSLCEFINRPLRHIQELAGILRHILDTTYPFTQEHAVFSQIVDGFQSVTDRLQAAEPLHTSVTSITTTANQSIYIPPSTAGRRVPVMGSLVLKRATSVKSSSSGFGSGSSRNSDTQSCPSECDSVFADMELTR